MSDRVEIDTLRKRLPYYDLRHKRDIRVHLDWRAKWERFDTRKPFDFDLSSIPERQLAAFRRRNDVLLDGNHAALSVMVRIVDRFCGYPIIPSTPIAEDFARAASNGKKNLFGDELMYVQPSDELSAIAAVEAMACQGGRYADNSSSQGLVLKTKNLFSVAGKRLPVIMTIMAREVNKGSLSIHCGHTDIYAVRNAGWAQLVAENNQELHDLLPIAFRVAELRQFMLPCMVIGDGFIKSHALENIRELSDEFLEYFVGPPNRLYQPNFADSTLVGTFTNTELGAIKPVSPVSIMNGYKNTFYQEMVKPISESRKVPWDRFLPVVPAGTSKYRDMSHVGTQLPLYDASKCVAYGLCTTSCSDPALYSTITDQPILLTAARYFKVLKKLPRGTSWQRFALNINVVSNACKGCGICASVCPTDALHIAGKTEVTEADFLPEVYENLDCTQDVVRYVDEMPLMQQVLFVFSKMYPGRHTLCPGCSEGNISLLTFYAAESLRNNPEGIATFYQGLRVLFEKNRRAIKNMVEHGFSIYTINATGCSEVSELVNPYNSRTYQSGHYGFGMASAAALGAKFAFDQSYKNGFKDVLTKVIVFAGDGAIYDIGNGPFNYALGENHDITWIIYNNEGYMNTGAQKSGASRFGSDRSTSPIGTRFAGKTTLHRRLMSQAMAISHVYAAKLSIDNPQYAIKILKEAIAYNGPSVVEFFSACPQGQQGPDWAGPLISRMLVEARKWQIAVRRPFQRVDISGNPEPKLIYPSEGKSFKKSIHRETATFYDATSMLGQHAQHIKTQEGGSIPEIVMVNEMVSSIRWLRNQYMAGYRESIPSEEEIEAIVKEHYRR